MKYKWKDKVRIKSKKELECISEVTDAMLKNAGAIMTIGCLVEDADAYIMKEDGDFHFLWSDEMIEGLVEEETKNNNDMEEKETLLGWVKETDSLRLVPHKDYEIKHDGDNFYLVKKKKEYPKTYEECCEVLQYNKYLTVYPPFDADIPNYDALHLFDLLEALRKLFICRDAYWTIYGEENGLGKPWKPDWKNDEQFKYIIICRRGCIIKDTYTAKNIILAFPTEEMRDAFYENFKKEIEICKELL